MFGFVMSIRCYNMTSRTVCVMYLNEYNEPIYERVLNPYMSFELDIIDYIDYAWICFDVNRRSQLLLNGERRYHIRADYDNGFPLIRELVYVPLSNIIIVNLPVLPLLQRSVEIVMDNLTSKDDVTLLPIPETLKELLQTVLS